MARSGVRTLRVGAVAVLLFCGLVAGIVPGPAAADVTAVRGSAYGYFADNISIFGGAQPDTGPVPTVALPAGGSASPVTGSAATGLVKYGPATIFSSGAITLSTQGTTGPSGSVTTSANLANVNSSGQEVFTASALSSTCTASESGRSGSTSITGGRLIVSEGADLDSDADDTVIDIPASPAPNTAREGKIETVGDTFRYVFNEQVVGADGSITVNAAHLYLIGPTALGDVIIGQSICGVTAVAATTTTTAGGATTTTAQGATTTTAAAATTTTAPAATTTTAAGATTTTAAGATTTTTTAAGATTTSTAAASGGSASGGGFGFFVSVSLFGGPAASKGPDPSVTLPDGGSTSPVTRSAPSGIAQFGPATLYTSDELTVSTQGTPGGTVTSSAKATNINKSTVHASQTGSESFTADTVSSTCSSSGTSQSGSSSLAAAKLVTSVGTDFDSEADDVVVTIPADPAPNTSYTGKIENVGDEFRIVFNEQQRGDGSITVNAVHMYLLGPIAKGELIIAQSRCGTSATGGGGGGTASVAGGTVASTGTHAARTAAVALLLVAVGGHVRFGWPGLRWAGPETGPEAARRRAMPWGRRRSLSGGYRGRSSAR
jgi:hypothetical protein